MKFQARTEFWVTPDIENNLTLPENKRLQVKIRRANAETVGDLSSTETIPTESGKGFIFKTHVNVGRILRDHVLEIKNCEIEDLDTKEVKQIKTGKELAESSAFEIRSLIDWLCYEVTRKTLPEEFKKKLGQGCSSSTTDGQAQTGTAT